MIVAETDADMSRFPTAKHLASWAGTTGTLYDDPGADYFTQLNPGRAKKHETHQLEAMGYRITLDHASERDQPLTRDPPSRGESSHQGLF